MLNSFVLYRGQWKWNPNQLTWNDWKINYITFKVDYKEETSQVNLKPQKVVKHL